MSGKIYSHIDKIPSGSASRKVTEGCLVLEGGAFRGLYSQGFMDAMMKASICSVPLAYQQELWPG